MKLYFLTKLADNPKINVGTGQGEVNIPTLTGDQLLTNVLNTTYFIAGALAIIVIVVAGLMFVSSTGNPQRVAIARNALIYSVVGLIIVLSAFVLTNFVIGSFN